MVALDGDALLWYQWEHGRRPIRGWAEMKQILLQQFRPTAAGSLHEQWLNHHQIAVVVEYRRGFIELMAPLVGVPEEIAKGQYINGLKAEIKAELRLLGPRSLDQAMDLSLKIEEKLKFGNDNRFKNRGNGTNSGYKGTYSFYSANHYSPNTGTSELHSSGGSSSPSRAPSLLSQKQVHGIPVSYR